MSEMSETAKGNPEGAVPVKGNKSKCVVIVIVSVVVALLVITAAIVIPTTILVLEAEESSTSAGAASNEIDCDIPFGAEAIKATRAVMINANMFADEILTLAHELFGLGKGKPSNPKPAPAPTVWDTMRSWKANSPGPNPKSPTKVDINMYMWGNDMSMTKTTFTIKKSAAAIGEPVTPVSNPFQEGDTPNVVKKGRSLKGRSPEV